MKNITISELQPKEIIIDTDVLLIEDDKSTYKVTKSNLLKEVKDEQERLKLICK